MTYAAEQLMEEVAYVSYHYHWSPDVVLDMEHPDRRRFAAALEQLVPSEPTDPSAAS